MHKYTCHAELGAPTMIIERMLDWKDDRTWAMDPPISDEGR